MERGSCPYWEGLREELGVVYLGNNLTAYVYFHFQRFGIHGRAFTGGIYRGSFTLVQG